MSSQANGGGMGWIGPAIEGGTALAGGLMGKHAQNKASDQSLQATREALEYQKRKDAYEMAWNVAQAEQERQNRAYHNAAAMSLLGSMHSGHGSPMPSLGNVSMPDPSRFGFAPQAGMSRPSGVLHEVPRSSPMAPQIPSPADVGAPSTPMQGMTLGDLWDQPFMTERR